MSDFHEWYEFEMAGRRKSMPGEAVVAGDEEPTETCCVQFLSKAEIAVDAAFERFKFS